MTNEEIKKRIPYIREQINQNESDLRFGVRTIRQYWETNFYLMEEINNLIEQAKENNFNDMMGNPIKIIEGWFGCR